MKSRHAHVSDRGAHCCNPHVVTAVQPTCAEVPLPWPHCTSKHAPQPLMSSWWAKELLGPSAAMHVGGRVAGGVWSMGALPEASVNCMHASTLHTHM